MLSLTVAGVLVAAGLAVGLLAALYMFCTLKVEIRALRRQPGAPAAPADWQRRLSDLETRLLAADGSCPDSEPGPAQASAMAVRPSMNLNWRSQALRLARRGELPEQIASRLGRASGEIRLLLKIHGMLIHQALAGPRPSAMLKTAAESADIFPSAPLASREQTGTVDSAPGESKRSVVESK